MTARYRHVAVAGVAYEAPPEELSSEAIEQALRPLYERLGLVEGRLELMTGIRARRVWRTAVRPSTIATHAARKALDQAGLDPKLVGATVFSSVCRDQLEPASAHAVHHALGLPSSSHVFDLSNACLGVLNGVLAVANMIELGQIRAGLVTAGEDGRPLLDGTIERLAGSEEVTRQSIKADFASLTIGSGAAAVLLCHEDLRPEAPRFLGAVARTASEHHDLCVGGVGEGLGLVMATDAEALLDAGLVLAASTYREFVAEVAADGFERVITHQVGRAHHVRLLRDLGLDPSLAFTTFEDFGNVGSVSLPLTWARALEAGFISRGQRVALLGIGSGLGCTMGLVAC
ncbi:MAG: 3-oxoacyl-ACP synthase III [Myxococcales bacterium]|nr:3-oxoacyl-ACP synthase III [Myxococcales bacterium]